MQDADYRSGDDIVLEFVEHRYAFSAADFRERVSAAAVRLDLVDPGALDDDGVEDLVEIAVRGSLSDPRSGLGRHLLEHRDALRTHGGRPVSYWLRKLVFRGAWLDQRVKSGALDIVFDQTTGDFRYLLPDGERPVVDASSHPSFRAVRYRG